MNDFFENSGIRLISRLIIYIFRGLKQDYGSSGYNYFYLDDKQINIFIVIRDLKDYSQVELIRWLIFHIYILRFLNNNILLKVNPKYQTAKTIFNYGLIVINIRKILFDYYLQVYHRNIQFSIFQINFFLILVNTHKNDYNKQQRGYKQMYNGFFLRVLGYYIFYKLVSVYQVELQKSQFWSIVAFFTIGRKIILLILLLSLLCKKEIIQLMNLYLCYLLQEKENQNKNQRQQVLTDIFDVNFRQYQCFQYFSLLLLIKCYQIYQQFKELLLTQILNQQLIQKMNINELQCLKEYHYSKPIMGVCIDQQCIEDKSFCHECYMNCHRHDKNKLYLFPSLEDWFKQFFMKFECAIQEMTESFSLIENLKKNFNQFKIAQLNLFMKEVVNLEKQIDMLNLNLNSFILQLCQLSQQTQQNQQSQQTQQNQQSQQNQQNQQSQYNQQNQQSQYNQQNQQSQYNQQSQQSQQNQQSQQSQQNQQSHQSRQNHQSLQNRQNQQSQFIIQFNKISYNDLITQNENTNIQDQKRNQIQQTQGNGLANYDTPTQNSLKFLDIQFKIEEYNSHVEITRNGKLVKCLISENIIMGNPMIPKTGITKFAIKLLNPVYYVALGVGKKDMLLQINNQPNLFQQKEHGTYLVNSLGLVFSHNSSTTYKNFSFKENDTIIIELDMGKSKITWTKLNDNSNISVPFQNSFNLYPLLHLNQTVIQVVDKI
ncbi:unnamed protein product [Paramecium primaurelia]|uniref:Uncharacterized protein n=1 Tax=Paramecium primaurelia TaxID=5886 RepID=A0A8S1PSC5_PARPR|nr:unnamed protein product [Paramecium primaurelia]